MKSAIGIPLLLLVTLPSFGCTYMHGASRGRSHHLAPPRAAAVVDPGLLVVAPDRGYLGNEETRDSFAAWSADYNAELVFVTDERTTESLQSALARLRERGAGRIAVLPFFVSASHPGLSLVSDLLGLSSTGGGLDAVADVTVSTTMGQPFGNSYLAVEILADRLRRIDDPAGRRLVVVGYGADDELSRQAMQEDWQRITEAASQGLGFESVRSLVSYDMTLLDDDTYEQGLIAALANAVEGAERPVVVPFHLGRKLDGMMTFTGYLRQVLPRGVELLTEEITPHKAVAVWMEHEANRHVSLRPDDIGVVLLAHGADFHWNQAIRAGVSSLQDRYNIEFAFGMADQPLLERAIRRLERRRARAIIIVRVFGLASSFKPTVERMIGADVESGVSGVSAHHHHGHQQHPGPRIRSAALLTTLGGLEADPLFAEALLDQARQHSSDPSRETVILVAHGAGDDARNEHWLEILDDLASTIRSNGGASFRAVRFATWREDWPDKRGPWLDKVRAMVEDAGRDDGRVIVLPARTTGRGREREFLSGLDYELGSGFSPHPLFARWVEKQIRAGTRQLRPLRLAGARDDD